MKQDEARMKIEIEVGGQGCGELSFIFITMITINHEPVLYYCKVHEKSNHAVKNKITQCIECEIQIPTMPEMSQAYIAKPSQAPSQRYYK